MSSLHSHSCSLRRPFAVRSKQSGLSLIELMVATVLSLIIIAALATLYGDMSRGNREMAKTNSQIENARFAMQFLQNDIIHAGYWNAFVPEFNDLTFVGSPTDYPAFVPDPCKAFADWTSDDLNALVGIPVQVLNWATVPASCGGLVADRLADSETSDVLVVRHADTCGAGEGNCEVYDAANLYFEVTHCETELENLPKDYVLDPNSPSSPLTERDCTTAVAKRKYIQTLYYVRDYAVTSGDGIPTLVRSEFGGAGLAQQPVQALVEGVERFRVELGLDLLSETNDPVDPNSPIVWVDPDEWTTATNRGDGIPETFVHCGSGCTVGQLANVVAVKLFILARANEATAGYVDTKRYNMGSAAAIPASDLTGTNFKRHVFSTTVRINNTAAHRETP